MHKYIVEFSYNKNKVNFFVNSTSFDNALKIGKEMRKRAGINGHKYKNWCVRDAEVFFKDQISK